MHKFKAERMRFLTDQLVPGERSEGDSLVGYCETKGSRG